MVVLRKSLETAEKKKEGSSSIAQKLESQSDHYEVTSLFMKDDLEKSMPFEWGRSIKGSTAAPSGVEDNSVDPRL